ncbi:hypothetical protein AX17_003871 [Amanita inopinata Kibby_2008]|nr:hypothetical protein AX17_003871 [Amanita inopinata Kibby_2008]
MYGGCVLRLEPITFTLTLDSPHLSPPPPPPTPTASLSWCHQDIETLILSGKLFGNTDPRSSSPERSPSPDSGWHDEELKNRRISPLLARPGSDDGNDGGSDSDVARRRAFDALHRSEQSTQGPIGMGPGRTGVKGVIRDRNEAVGREREQQKREAEELRRQMEKSSLGGMTFLEEEREKARDPLYQGKIDELVLKEREKMRELRGEGRDMFGRRKERRFGHLREVGVEGFVSAVEEERGVWVVVHLYDSSLERCDDVDDTLTQLARIYPDTKFLRARASALGFASSSSKPSTSCQRKEVAYQRYLNHSLRSMEEDDCDDMYFADEVDEEGYDSDGNNVDLDMLPTLLVYRDGELVHNWVRVDWEAGDAGVENLLERHRILPRGWAGQGRDENLGLPPDTIDDDDDDLAWSDSDFEK